MARCCSGGSVPPRQLPLGGMGLWKEPISAHGFAEAQIGSNTIEWKNLSNLHHLSQAQYEAQIGSNTFEWKNLSNLQRLSQAH